MYLKKKIYLLIISLLIIQSFFEIIFYYDYLLPSIDTIFQFGKLKNFIENGIPFYEYYPNSNVGWDKFDIFEFFTVLTNKIFYEGLNLNLNIRNFIIFETSVKLFVLISVFLLFFFQFKNLNLSLFSFVFILFDASFTHVLHNVHQYLILTLIICFLIINTNYLKKNYIIGSILIGSILTYGCLSIVVSGIVIGVTFIISIVYFYVKKIINFKTLFFLIFGCIISILIYLNFNLFNILELYKISNESSPNEINKIFYTTKYTLLNIYFLFFGQHGNNFVLIYLLYLFSFAHNLDNKFDKNLFIIIKIYLIIFILSGILIDPMHFYPSRIGIITPFVIYLLTKLFLKNDLFNSYKVNLSSATLLSFSFFHQITTSLDYLSRYQNFFITILFSSLILIFIHTKKSKLMIKYNLVLCLICMIIKFFPYFKIDHIKNYLNRENSELIITSIDHNLKLLKEEDCIVTNYANYSFFKNRKLVSLQISGEHINKKNAYGTNNCSLLILFVDQIKKEELLPFKKIMSLKKLDYNISQNDLKYFYFREYNYKIFSIKDIDNVKIFYSLKTNEKLNQKDKILHLSYY